MRCNEIVDKVALRKGQPKPGSEIILDDHVSLSGSQPTDVGLDTLAVECLKRYYGISTTPLCLRGVGAKVGKSHERVNQIIAKSITQYKDYIYLESLEFHD